MRSGVARTAATSAAGSSADPAGMTTGGAQASTISVSDATVTLRFVDGAPTITAIALDTVGSVPGIDEATFKAAAQGAKEGCVVSRALAGVGEITLEASLA